MPHPGDSLRPCLTQIAHPLKLFSVFFPYEWLVLAHASDFPKIFQISSIWPMCLYFTTSGPSPSTGRASFGSQLGLAWAPPSPAQLAAICRSLCISGRVTLRRTKVVADLGLHYPGGPRVRTPSGQLQTMSKNHPVTSTIDTLKGSLSGYQSSTEVSPAPWGVTPHS